MCPFEAIEEAPVRSAPRGAPDCLATNRYYDRVQQIEAAKVLPGEYFVTERNMMLVTVLGSCVAACIHDPAVQLGGMNHFMLPESDTADPVGAAARYGTHAMEMLINRLLKGGARRDRLEAKLFGGGSVIPGMTQTDIGRRNAAFALQFLQTERIRVVASDLADVFPRKMYYFPVTGRALVKRLYALKNDTILKREDAYRARLTDENVRGDVELFA
jgi:chemotaxis protein CheD